MQIVFFKKRNSSVHLLPEEAGITGRHPTKDQSYRNKNLITIVRLHGKKKRSKPQYNYNTLTNEMCLNLNHVASLHIIDMHMVEMVYRNNVKEIIGDTQGPNSHCCQHELCKPSCLCEGISGEGFIGI